MEPVCMHGKVTDIVGPLELSQVREWIKFHQQDNSKCWQFVEDSNHDETSAHAWKHCEKGKEREFYLFCQVCFEAVALNHEIDIDGVRLDF